MSLYHFEVVTLPIYWLMRCIDCEAIHIQEWAGLVKQSARRWGICWCMSSDSSMELTWTQIFAICKPRSSKDQIQRILTSISFYCWWLDAIILKILTSLERRRKLLTMDLSVSLINKQNRQSKMDTLEHTRCHIHSHILYTPFKFYLQGTTSKIV